MNPGSSWVGREAHLDADSTCRDRNGARGPCDVRFAEALPFLMSELEEQQRQGEELKKREMEWRRRRQQQRE